MSKFYIGVQKDEPITEIVWTNKDGDEESIILSSRDKYITIRDRDVNEVYLYTIDIPKLEAALAKARELGWFE